MSDVGERRAARASRRRRPRQRGHDDGVAASQSLPTRSVGRFFALLAAARTTLFGARQKGIPASRLEARQASLLHYVAVLQLRPRLPFVAPKLEVVGPDAPCRRRSRRRRARCRSSGGVAGGSGSRGSRARKPLAATARASNGTLLLLSRARLPTTRMVSPPAVATPLNHRAAARARPRAV
jgi:hypothetical protein